MVKLIRLDLADHLKQAGIAFERGGVKLDLIEQMAKTGEAVLGVLKRDAAHHAMDFITQAQEQLGQVRPVLAGNPGDQRFGLGQRRAPWWEYHKGEEKNSKSEVKNSKFEIRINVQNSNDPMTETSPLGDQLGKT
jgi:hypothetical protein